MFNGARDFTVTAAEFNDVKGSIFRDNSPTVFNVRSAPFGAPFANNGVNNPVYPSNAPIYAASSPTARTGSFAGATHFSLIGAEVNRAEGDMVRRSSGTTMTLDFAQPANLNQRGYGGYYSGEAYDNAGSGSYNGPPGPSANYQGGQFNNGHHYAHQRPPNASGSHHGYAMAPSDRQTPYINPGGVLRRNSESPYPNSAANSGSRRFKQPAGAQSPKPQGSKTKRKSRGKKERSRPTAEDPESESETESRAPQGISRTSTY
ncbi:hypothetical protein DFH09DRAFT_1156076 [Mycena vulgaris]|nr:hypothetical protein DFH09DRAFT_1156076 [Mycena vulgaris]